MNLILNKVRIFKKKTKNTKKKDTKILIYFTCIYVKIKYIMYIMYIMYKKSLKIPKG